jgi:hypothetical protein
MLRKEDGEFMVSLGYMVRPCLKKQKRSQALFHHLGDRPLSFPHFYPLFFPNLPSLFPLILPPSLQFCFLIMLYNGIMLCDTFSQHYDLWIHQVVYVNNLKLLICGVGIPWYGWSTA